MTPPLKYLIANFTTGQSRHIKFKLRPSRVTRQPSRPAPTGRETVVPAVPRAALLVAIRGGHMMPSRGWQVQAELLRIYETAWGQIDTCQEEIGPTGSARFVFK